MKKTILAAILAAVAFTQILGAGEIKPGAVPGSINYQGRLERDNAPVTGQVHLIFRIFNAPEAGTQRWVTPSEIIVDAVQGIFSANITPPWDTFSRAETLYLEVQVESEVLTPREPLGSVAYAMVAKKLEDGASVSVTTLTANYQVLLATDTDSKVGIGTNSPAYKLSVNGSIKLMGPSDAIYFSDGSPMFSANVGAAGSVSSTVDSVLEADSDFNDTGEMIFKTANVERMRIKNSSLGGRIGVGPMALAAPMGTVDIDGSLYVGSQGIYDRLGGSVTVNGVYVSGGGITGANSEYLLVGSPDNVIAMVSNGAERMRVHSNGFVGIGLAVPAVMLHSASDIASDTGVRGGEVSIGAYGGALANEIRGEGANLLIQQNGFNVGIGTDSPKEKLHVRGNIRADGGITAETADLSGNAAVRGDFKAVSGINRVELSSTIIYGTLDVTGGIAGGGAYLASTQTFTGQNTFQNRVMVSSDIMVGGPVGYAGRLAIGAADFNFSGSAKYLQIGDKNPIFNGNNALAYMVGGSNADAQLYFYRGATQIASLETQLDKPTALALTVAGQTKILVDDVYSRIQNNVLWISTGYATTPAIFVSSSTGNVGIGTANPDNKLTIDGNIRISGPTSNGIIFADGSSMLSAATVGAAVLISNSGDALVQADADSNGLGSVILKTGNNEGLIIKSSKVGIGTSNPVSRLNVQNGALVVGNPTGVDAYLTGTNLIVGGSLILDGGLIQRSATPALFAALTVSDNVYLSTAPGAMTRIGNDTLPAHTLDVTGDINASGNIMTGGTTRISAAGAWSGNTIAVDRGGTGITAGTSGGVPYFSAAAAIDTSAALAQYNVLIGGGAGAAPYSLGSAGNAGQALISGGGSANPSWGTLDASNGGTGQGGGYTIGDILYASSAVTLSKLNDAAEGNALISGGAGFEPSYGKIGLTTHVSGTLPVGNGGTGQTTLASGAVLLGNGTSGISTVAGQSISIEVVVSTMTPECASLTFQSGILISTGTIVCH
ncbi:MAG: hypothetical protein A2021_00960 [Elusimicrobia bacterium GWF2_52_66]|nr:MAG: hypothetical protein A2021_00960 [Elusimicrobia bacterium GWF2_52_66]HAF95366.1 hypothetical protein [Elusimicrobiota bacterium]HCE98770.1 hypothetical protein [Elusimicrobiota bacterium]